MYRYAETVIAGLLHDTVEDTDHVTFESIQERFGPAVRRIVEGETKVSKVSSSVSKQVPGRVGTCHNVILHSHNVILHSHNVVLQS